MTSKTKKFEGDSQGMAWAVEQRLPSSNREKKPYDQFEIAEKQAGKDSLATGNKLKQKYFTLQVMITLKLPLKMDTFFSLISKV